MALSNTTVNGTAVPGLLQSITTGTQPVGQKTTSPNTNITPPANTTPTPAPIDLSSKYANVNGTIYNTQSGTKFSNSADFFKDSGQSSFSNLKFNTNYSPTGSETIYGQQPVQPAPQAQPTPQTPPVSSNPAPSGATATSTGNPTPTTATGAPATPPPPNAGATGVSQGTIIGGQIANASNNPDYQKYQGLYQQLAQKIADTTKSEQEQLGANANNPIPIEFQQGRSSILQSQYGGLLQALATQQGAAQQGVNNSISEQGATTSGLASAGSLNAPITNPQTGGLVSPSANTTTNSTTSGAANLSSLIGQRTVPGQTQAEFYNTQTGQGFSTPQQLADFVNQQMPGANANAQNVFSLLQAQSSGQAVKPSDPYYQTLQGFAQQLASGQVSAVPYGSLPPVIQQQLLQMAKAINPSFDFNTATAQGSAQQSIIANQTNQAAVWKSAQQMSQALTGQLQPLLSQINPSQLTVVNGVIQGVANQLGNPTYQQAANLLTEIANTYANVLNPSGGTLTDTVRNTATGMINGLASGQSIAQVIAGLDAQAQAKISAIPTQTNLSGLTSGGGNIPAGSLTITAP